MNGVPVAVVPVVAGALPPVAAARWRTGLPVLEELDDEHPAITSASMAAKTAAQGLQRLEYRPTVDVIIPPC